MKYAITLTVHHLNSLNELLTACETRILTETMYNKINPSLVHPHFYFDHQ